MYWVSHLPSNLHDVLAARGVIANWSLSVITSCHGVDQNTSYISCTAGQSKQKGGREVFEELIWEEKKRRQLEKEFSPSIKRITTFSSAAITREMTELCSWALFFNALSIGNTVATLVENIRDARKLEEAKVRTETKLTLSVRCPRSPATSRCTQATQTLPPLRLCPDLLRRRRRDAIYQNPHDSWVNS